MRNSTTVSTVRADLLNGQGKVQATECQESGRWRFIWFPTFDSDGRPLCHGTDLGFAMKASCVDALQHCQNLAIALQDLKPKARA